MIIDLLSYKMLGVSQQNKLDSTIWFTLVWERARVKDHPKYFIAKEHTVEADLIIMNKLWSIFKIICH